MTAYIRLIQQSWINLLYKDINNDPTDLQCKTVISKYHEYKHKSIFTSTLLILLIMLVVADKANSTTTMPAAKADVFIIQPPQNLTITLKYPAQIKSLEKVKVVARISGGLEKKHFTEGVKIAKGDLLYSIEDDIYRAKVNVAQASLEINQAALNNASRNWTRIKNLFKTKSVSEDSRDTALSVYEQALASISLATANLHQAQIDLAYTQVKAPISGVIGLPQIDVGNFVSSNPPSQLVEITQNNKVYVEFSMPLRDYSNIKNNLWITPDHAKFSVQLEINNQATDKIGVIDFVDININKSTSTVKMRAVVNNNDGYLMEGEFVRVMITNMVQKNVISIPQKAVLQNPQGSIVFVAENGRVKVKPVTLGNETGENYIVAGGPLRSGDQVIINNFFRLNPDAEVQIDKIINKEDK